MSPDDLSAFFVALRSSDDNFTWTFESAFFDLFTATRMGVLPIPDERQLMLRFEWDKSQVKKFLLRIAELKACTVFKNRTHLILPQYPQVLKIKKASIRSKKKGLPFKPIEVFDLIYEEIKGIRPNITKADAIVIHQVAKSVKAKQNFSEVCEEYFAESTNYIVDAGWPGRFMQRNLNAYILTLDLQIPIDEDQTTITQKEKNIDDTRTTLF